ncbi:MAG TPA: (d)CMP kinase, partial [Anaerolineae bacterium]|nr:(d)CMP kinase [Anaerolineae bacterium]
CDGEDITWSIREPRIEQHVSPVSAYPGVRLAMTAQQRRIGLQGKVIMVGRDIGTVVLPEAQLKIYLDATVEERAHRRYHEIQARGNHAETFDEILAAMQRRDAIDSNRAAAPLKPAPDAVIIDSTRMNILEVIATVEKLINAN